MSSPIPIRTSSLDGIQAQLQILTEQVTRLQPAQRPAMFEPPDRIPRAVVEPKRYTSSLPHYVMEALHLYSKVDNRAINVIISEALRSYIPSEHFNVVLEDLRLEQRRLWSEEATPQERMG